MATLRLKKNECKSALFSFAVTIMLLLIVHQYLHVPLHLVQNESSFEKLKDNRPLPPQSQSADRTGNMDTFNTGKSKQVDTIPVNDIVERELIKKSPATRIPIADKDHTTVTPAKSKEGSPISQGILDRPNTVICDTKSSMYKQYRAEVDSQQSEENLKWCQDTMRTHRVNIGRSWGGLRKGGQREWDTRHCNDLLVEGKQVSCAVQWGWESFDRWRTRKVEQPVTATVTTAQPPDKAPAKGSGDITCIINSKSSKYCRLRNVVVDFKKMHENGRYRSFDPGFIEVSGTFEDLSDLPAIPGLSVDPKKQPACSAIESRSTFLLSNDDIFNLGHFSNDLMGIWAMTVLADQDSMRSTLLNVDGQHSQHAYAVLHGYRRKGPAGGGFHRLMDYRKPDSYGPYRAYYDSWFENLYRAIDFRMNQTSSSHLTTVPSTDGIGVKGATCFAELYVPPDPGTAWFWNDWSLVNDCSMVGPSPLYQSFNVFLRQRWLEKFGAKSLLFPPPKEGDAEGKKVHIVIEVRAINPKKTNNHSSARHIKNLSALIAALVSIGPHIKVTTQDFAKIPFAEQVSLSHSASIFVSMHGAGTTHIFHSAIGSPNCCALVELFPDTTIGFQSAQGYGNIARMLGMHHSRHVSPLGSTFGDGTMVQVDKIKQLVETAALNVQGAPTCLHDVKDTTQMLTQSVNGPTSPNLWTINDVRE